MGIGAEDLRPGSRLKRLVRGYAEQIGERVIVTDDDDIVLADSDGEDVGQDYDNGQRPEVAAALDPAAPAADARIRFSEPEGIDILVAAAPILDGGLVSAVRTTHNVQGVTRRGAGHPVRRVQAWRTAQPRTGTARRYRRGSPTGLRRSPGGW